MYLTVRSGTSSRVLCAALLWSLSLASAHAQTTEQSLRGTMAGAFASGSEVECGGDSHGRDWSWLQFEVYDEAYPLTIDIVASKHEEPRRIIYFLPGGGTNFQASFFSPVEANLAHDFRERGYLVIGITPREDSIAYGTQDFSFTQTWGMDKQRADVRSIIANVQRVLPLPYEVLGHSYGASTALDYASKYSHELERVIALDIYSIDPELDPQGVAQAEATRATHVELLNQGTYVDPGGADAPLLSMWTDEERSADSGVSREELGVPGNFTNESLYYFALIYAGDLPGLHSSATGLSGDWPMFQGTFAGTYTLDPDPLADTYVLTHVDESTLLTSSAASGSGLYSIAFARDYWSVVAGNPEYAIDWSAITTKLVWMNCELGYGTQTHGAELARKAGNAEVEVFIIPGYGHGDVLSSRSADKDAWELLH
jgi:pimeloyl-ACP methyl ester carboxylesterase